MVYKVQVKLQLQVNLAYNLLKQNKKPLLVACDIYRPAAIKQLQVVGEKVEVPVFTMGDKDKSSRYSKSCYRIWKEKQS